MRIHGDNHDRFLFVSVSPPGMKLCLRNLRMGCTSEEDGRKKSITDGELIEENDLITRKLTARPRGMLDSAAD